MESLLLSRTTTKVLGNNKWGQLGNGTNEPSSTPVMIEASGVTSVSAGGGHLLYIKKMALFGEEEARWLGIGNKSSKLQSKFLNLA